MPGTTRHRLSLHVIDELTRILMGYSAATGRGTSRTDAMQARDLAPTAFRRRNSSRISRRQEGCWFQLSLNRAACSFLCAVHGAVGERGEGGSRRRLRKTGRCALTASRKKRIARASDVLVGTAALPPSTRESTLRISPDRKTPAIGLSRTQILKLKEWGPTLLSSRVDE